MLKFNKKEDLLVIKWLIKAIVVWLLISEVIWESGWVQAYIAGPYTGVVAWELEKILHLLGYEVARDHADLAIRGIPYAIGISPRCTGLSAGFFIYLGVVTTLPAPALRARIFWLALGAAVLTATNIFRVTLGHCPYLDGPEPFRVLPQNLNRPQPAGGRRSFPAGGPASNSQPHGDQGLQAFRREGSGGDHKDRGRLTNGSPNKYPRSKNPVLGQPLEGDELALLPMGQDLLATRSLRSLDRHRLFALPTMAKQKMLPFGKDTRGVFAKR